MLSSGEKNIYRDKQAKLKLYSQGGVQEYWIVDRFRKELEIYRPEKGQLMLVETLTDRDLATSPLLPNFSLSIAEKSRLDVEKRNPTLLPKFLAK